MTIEIIDADKTSLMDLFAARKPIYQAHVRGTFRRTKYIFMAILLGMYYILPWVRWHRGETAPDQAILIDIVGRKFYFFFIELWPQEIFYFTGLLLIAALGLFFATSLFGRVWCGYACPQTVWTDLFFIVERWWEGDRNAQVKLAEAPWSFSKLGKKLGKHATWIFIGLATGGAWVFYFNDAPTLWNQFFHGQFDFVPTFWIGFLTFSTYIMAGFAREQVCTYMCPYARFQGAMFDEESLIVTYDKARGEPRGKGEGHGDCIDCGRCVAVCPVGIDIRDGQQYRCINCGLCVDACTPVMEKLGKTTGLIRYNTLNGTVPANVGIKGVFKHARLVRPRTLYYATIITIVATVMFTALLTRPLVGFNALHQRSPLFITLADGSIRNTYTLRIVNKTWKDQTYNLSTETQGLKLSTDLIKEPTNTPLPLTVKPGRVAEYTVFIDAPNGQMKEERTKLILTIENADKSIKTTYSTMFIIPENEGGML